MFLKITAGFLKGRRFAVPSTKLRPTGEKVRSAFFNTLFSMIDFDNRNFLDLFSGSGAFVFEALSRGFKSGCAVEKDPVCAKQIRLNAIELGITEQTEVFREDIFLTDLNQYKEKKFHAIYIDPPYALGDKMGELLEKIVNHSIVDEVCVICVEGSSFTEWKKEGWSLKQKKFGDTHLSFFYNWGGDNE